MPRASFSSVALLMCLTAAADPVRPVGHWAPYIGAFPCAGNDRFFREQGVRQALGDALGQDYDRFEKHRALSGCSKISLFRSWLFVDISQPHVGGYTSMLLFDPVHLDAYVFWLDSPVTAGRAKTYGHRPIPTDALQKFTRELNRTWGHVATFGIIDGEVGLVNTQPNNRWRGP